MEVEKSTLYLVGTPIGNLDDMTYRAVEVLNKVDMIGAEDTRNSIKLLNHFNIKKPLISYHEYNKKERGKQLIKELQEGKSIAIITDAGMPAISDPGEDLVRLCHENGLKVSPIPGACAAVCAIAASGIDTTSFTFEGFLSTSTKERKGRLESLKNEKRTMIFYEAPHKLKNTLGDLYDFFGDRTIVLGRELTKRYEEIVSTTIKDAITKYETVVPKGEFALVIAGSKESTEAVYSSDDVEKMLKSLLATGLSNKEAVKEAVSITGLKKNMIYEISLNMKEDAR